MRITNIMKNHTVPHKKNENHETIIIPSDNKENHENHKISVDNN